MKAGSATRFILPLLAGLLAACGDATAPEPATLAAVEPAEGATAVAASPTIQLTYSGRISLPGNNAAVLTVLHAGGAVAGTVTLPDSRTLAFTPADILDPATRYTVQLAPALRDAGGHTLPGKSWDFTTAGYAATLGDGAAVWAHIGALAHDSMGGRRGASVEELQAADYIRRQLQDYGLSAGAPSWYQTFTYAAGSSQNVVGALAGTGALKDEWVVIGGHYDHIGRNASGVVYNGADDNASGTALMLELARVLAGHAQAGGFGAQDRRSVLFMAFGAEEAGLIGSNYFCAHPLVPLASIAGMINLDMVGRLRDNAITVHGLESSGRWPALVARYRGSLLTAAGGLVGTDYRCFLQHQTPALALFTGLHEDYHKPTDDLEKINLPGIMQVGRLALGLATNLMLRPRVLTGP